MSVQALQRQRAMRLYRHGLKQILYYAIRRELWWEEVRSPISLHCFCLQHSLQAWLMLSCDPAIAGSMLFDLPA